MIFNSLSLLSYYIWISITYHPIDYAQAIEDIEIYH
jgi:hypothetical protein